MSQVPVPGIHLTHGTHEMSFCSQAHIYNELVNAFSDVLKKHAAGNGLCASNAQHVGHNEKRTHRGVLWPQEIYVLESFLATSVVLLWTRIQHKIRLHLSCLQKCSLSRSPTAPVG